MDSYSFTAENREGELVKELRDILTRKIGSTALKNIERHLKASRGYGFINYIHMSDKNIGEGGDADEYAVFEPVPDDRPDWVSGLFVFPEPENGDGGDLSNPSGVKAFPSRPAGTGNRIEEETPKAKTAHDIENDIRVLHEINVQSVPRIEEGKMLWHVIPVSLIPQDARYNQRAKIVALINDINRKYPQAREKIRIVTDAQDVASVVNELMLDPANIVDAALPDEGSINSLPRGVNMLVFRSKDGDTGNFRQFEGMIAALRVLQIKDLKERSERLSRIYRSLTGEECPGVPQISDPKEFARIFVFVLPPITAQDPDDLRRLGSVMMELMESA